MDGVIWPSVTQLLQEAKLIDYSSVPKDILEKKRILGTRVHAATVLLDNCELDEEHFNSKFPECIPYLEAYRKFRIIETFDQCEVKSGRMFSTQYKYHGEPDEHGIRIITKGQEHYLIDYKCTWSMFKSTGAQLSGYEILLKENFKIKINKRLGLLLLPTGNYELTDFQDKNDKQDFLACLFLWWQRVNKYKTLKPEKSMEGTNV
jgi:hypothetical protein